MKAATLFLVACLGCSPGVWAQTAGSSAATPGSAQAKRERDLKMPEIVRTLGVADGSKVADIGAGAGDFEIVLSRG